jgi:hypothetical protein
VSDEQTTDEPVEAASSAPVLTQDAEPEAIDVGATDVEATDVGAADVEGDVEGDEGPDTMGGAVEAPDSDIDGEAETTRAEPETPTIDVEAPGAVEVVETFLEQPVEAGDVATVDVEEEPAAPEPAAPEPAAPEPAGNARVEDEEAARIVALDMALAGTPRDETGRYLAEHYALADPDRLLDDVYTLAGP